MSRQRGFWILKKVIKVIKSFKIKELFLNIDTGDVIYNAYLYPLFYFLGGHNRSLFVNYSGEVQFKVTIQNRLINMLIAFIKP